MRKLALTTTLSALLVSLPLAGAFAESDDVRGLPDIDRIQTSSIGSTANGSYAKLLDSELVAAQTNLAAGGRDNAVNPAGAAQVRAEINTIRRAAAAERQANGGELSEASYRQLSAQAQAVHQAIHALHNGG